MVGIIGLKSSVSRSTYNEHVSNRSDDSAEATAWTPTDPVCYHDTNFGRVADILGEVGRLGGSSSSGSGQVINWLSCSIRDDGEQ